MGRFLLFPPPGCSTGGGALRHLSQWLGEKISVVWGISHASKERERERDPLYNDLQVKPFFYALFDSPSL